MHIKTNFQGKIEGRKEAVYRLKTDCTWNVSGLCTLNVFCYEISLCCGQSPCLDIATLSIGAYVCYHIPVPIISVTNPFFSGVKSDTNTKDRTGYRLKFLSFRYVTVLKNHVKTCLTTRLRYFTGTVNEEMEQRSYTIYIQLFYSPYFPGAELQ
jgi:hypothetical protein